MRFAIEKKAKVGSGGICRYDAVEHSVHMENCYTDGSLALENLYITIDFDISSKRVMGVSGYIGELANAERISFGEIDCVAEALLFLADDQNYVSGIAYETGFCGRAVWDPKKKYYGIFRVDINQMEEWYLIAKNMYVSVKDGELLGILIKLCTA